MCRQRWALVVGLTALAILALHFGEEVQRVASPPSPTWSRAVPVGETDLNTRVAVDPVKGGGYLLAWPVGDAVRFVRLLPGGQILHTGLIGDAGPAAEVVTGGQGSGAFFWQGPRGAGGVRLNPATSRVEARYALPADVTALAAAGEWLAAARPDAVDLYRLGPEGLARQARIPEPGVTQLAVAASPSGTLQVMLVTPARSGSLTLRRAVFKPGGAAHGPEPDFLGAFSTAGKSLSGLQVGFDRADLYFLLLWESFHPRTTQLQLAVAKGAAATPPHRSLTGEPLAWRPVFVKGLAGVGEVTAVALGPSGGALLEAAGVGKVVDRHGVGFQAFAARLGPEGFSAPAFASRAKGAVLQPALAGKGGERLLAFTESAGFGRYRVWVTGASAAFHRHNRLTAADLADALAGTVLGIFSFFLALYYLPGTLFLALVAVTLVYVLALTWAEHHDAEVFGLGLATYLISKTLLLDRTFYAVTVRSLLPAWLAPLPVGWLLSTFLFGLGVWAALSLRRSHRFATPYAGLVLVAAVDLPLTWLLYTPYLR